jgi:hypothetical protein
MSTDLAASTQRSTRTRKQNAKCLRVAFLIRYLPILPLWLIDLKIIGSTHD